MSATALPFVSIIIPAYNAEQTVVEALESATVALARALERFGDFECEIIAIDDGSEDATAARLDEFARRASWTRVLRNERNRGAAHSRNRGVDHSLGDVLFFLDADDRYEPDHVALLVERLLAEPDAHYAVAEFRVDEPIAPEWRAAIRNSSPINVAIRRWCFEFIGGFPEEEVFQSFGGEDVVFRNILNRFFIPAAPVSARTVHYRRRPGNSLDRQLDKFAGAKPSSNADERRRLEETTRRRDQIVLAFERRIVEWLRYQRDNLKGVNPPTNAPRLRVPR
jgi:glycosyltransferase involved in cell wall biosynthesis